VVWAVVLEVNSEFLNRHVEFAESLLDVSSFLILKRKDLLLDWSHGFLTDVDQGSLGVLKLNQEVFVHLELMLLQEHDGLFHWLDLIESSITDHFDISNVLHDFHEELFLLLGLGTLWNDFDANGNIVNEVLNVLNL